MFRGTERFFRTGYNNNLVADWIPALQGVEARLRAGQSRRCRLWPRRFDDSDGSSLSRFKVLRLRLSRASIERAKAAAKEAGISDRVTFQQAPATGFPDGNYDLIAMFDCLHDMGDPVGAGRHVKESLSADGTWLVVEPFAHDCLKDNLNPVGRVYYGASMMICTPASLSQEVGLGLGAQAGETKLRKVALEARFKHFRRATETPFNMVFEVRA
ncbi:class I SAM-dependent methyltransferase [Rhizobium sp. 3T7]|uniref:class I SAM-dependent methyltransferase n=1 Tax=Rhizobium sp. 3T7 TaxID=2874922 RepID=UPI0021E24500|nr:class I SAM-dependent methyltransferase [Rhizobium sp. 3T7]